VRLVYLSVSSCQYGHVVVSVTSAPRHLIEAGLSALAAFGLRKVAISDVADRAGVSRATAYRTFGSKEQMLAVLVGHEIDRFFAAAEREFDVEGSFEVRLSAALDFAVTWLRSHPVVQRLVTEEPETLALVAVERPDQLSYVQLVTARLAEMIQADPDSARLAVPPRQAAEFMTRLTISLVLAPDSVFTDSAQIGRILANGIARRN
jgi:AcrR family transcriptional regulator